MSFSPLASLETAQAWEDAAACRDHDATLFFGPNRFEPKQERLAREAAAKEVCSTCTVRSECLAYADDAGEMFGVWGGLSESDRRDRDLSGAA